MHLRHLAASALVLASVASGVVAAPSGASAASSPALSQLAGTLVTVAPLPESLWIPNTTRTAFRLTYVTSNALGRPTLSSGELFIPKGTMPKGGWPVISWAHGTSGLNDSCAPSLMGPAEPDRDFPYLSHWMAQGYAIVATDYAGLGTPGLPAYLNGESEAHNVVDMVKAARAYAASDLPAGEQLSTNWVVIGQSQGGGAAIYTARYATAFGGSSLHYLGAVGTGVPAYIEDYVSLLGPEVPPVPLTPALTAYVLYIIDSLRTWRPALGVDNILTPTGRKYLQLAEQSCVFAFEKQLNGVSLGSLFTRPLATLPHWKSVVDGYMKMPESGYDKPFFMGHGLLDIDVPYALTAVYVATLKLNHQPVTFKTYLADHSGALVASQKDAIPFVKTLFASASN